MKLNIVRFGSACGLAAGTFYAGCAILMALAGRETLIAFFNGIFHGLDLTPILRMQVGLGESLLGLINTVILSWLFGALVAAIYNAGRPGPASGEPT